METKKRMRNKAHKWISYCNPSFDCFPSSNAFTNTIGWHTSFYLLCVESLNISAVNNEADGLRCHIQYIPISFNGTITLSYRLHEIGDRLRSSCGNRRFEYSWKPFYLEIIQIFIELNWFLYKCFENLLQNIIYFEILNIFLTAALLRVFNYS